MAERLLTDADLRAAKPDAQKDLYLSDGGGLYARVLAGYTPKEKRIQFVYRYKIDGKTERFPCGTYPATRLAEARKRHAAARKIRDSGESPLQRSRAEKEARIAKAEAEAKERTVRTLFEEWERLYLAAHRKDKGALVRQFMESDVLPHIGGRRARSITKEDIVSVLDRIVDRGARRKANAVLSLLRQMFSWGVVRGSVSTDPTYNLLSKHIGGRQQVRDRALSPIELSELAQQLPSSGLSERAQIAVWLLLATGVRVGELLSARWTDIEWQKRYWKDQLIEAPTWLITDTKNGEPHLVHLSGFACSMLKRLEALGRTTYLFEGQSGGTSVEEGWMRKLVRSAQKAARLSLSGGEWRVHDLRRTMATRMQGLSVLPHVVEKCLNHKLEGILAVYQKDALLPERKEAFEKLGAYLDRHANPSSNVVELNRA